MKIPDETLIAYVDGELTGTERAAVEAAIADDPALAEAVRRHEALKEKVGGAFDSALDEPVPDHLIQLIAKTQPTAAAEVVDLAKARERKARGPAAKPSQPRNWAAWGALAACVVLAVLITAPAVFRTPAMMRQEGAGLVADGKLDRALTLQLASDPANAAALVRVGVSYVSQDGAYCRTFQAQDGSGLSGLACRGARGWRITTLAYADGSPKGAYQTASSETPQAITAAVAASMSGSPLDARSEASARKSGWRTAAKAR